MQSVYLIHKIESGEEMGQRFIASKKSAFVMTLLMLPTLFVGCTNFKIGATTASELSSGLSHSPAASVDASGTSEGPGSQELNENLTSFLPPLAQVEPASLNATQFVVKQTTEQPGDVKKQMAPRRVEQSNDRSFEQLVLNSDEKVLVDFYADWCDPCKKLSPVLDELAQETPGVRIVKVNIDQSPESARRYRVKSLPTLILFHGGKPIARRGGLLNKDSLRKLVTLQ